MLPTAQAIRCDVTDEPELRAAFAEAQADLRAGQRS